MTSPPAVLPKVDPVITLTPRPGQVAYSCGSRGVVNSTCEAQPVPTTSNTPARRARLMDATPFVGRLRTKSSAQSTPQVRHEGHDAGASMLGSSRRAQAVRGPGSLGLDTFTYTPNPVGRVQPGVGHARKPGDPFRTWTMRRQSRQVSSRDSLPQFPLHPYSGLEFESAVQFGARPYSAPETRKRSFRTGRP